MISICEKTQVEFIMTQSDVFDGHEFLFREELMNFSKVFKDERDKLVKSMLSLILVILN